MSKGISETAFASQVEDLLKIYNWRWTHFRPAWSSKGYRTPIKGHKGFPDYCCVRPPRLLFIELKDQYSKPSPEQEAWLGDLSECIRHITTEPVVHNRKGVLVSPTDGKPPTKWTLVKSLEIYLWRPSQRDEIEEILK